MPTVLSLLAAVPSIAVLPPAIAALFWLWLLASGVILAVRLVRRITRSDDEVELPPLPDVVPPSSTVSSFVDPATQTLAPPPRGATPPPLDPPLSVPVPPVPPAPLVPPAEPTGGRQGFFAGASADEPAPRPVDAPRPTVAEALSGVHMPCGLSPVVDGTVSIPNPFRVAFLTTDADAAGVGAAIGDELERLGYRLSTAAATELIARKPGVELRVILYPTPGAARRGLDAIFPAAPDGAVGLEIST